MTDLAVRAKSFPLLGELEAAGALTATSLDLSERPDLPYEQYEALGTMLGKINSGSRFWLGDWLRFGEAVYGEHYAQAAELTGLAPQTLANIQSVCHRVPPSLRRPSLSFSVHSEVASLHDRPDKQIEWLDVAEDERLTKAELRSRIRAVKQDDGSEVITPAVSLEQAARAVWHASTRIVGDSFIVPAEVMLVLREVLGE